MGGKQITETDEELLGHWLLKPSEAARLLKCSLSEVYRLLKDGLPAARTGKATIRIRSADLKAYIDQKVGTNESQVQD